MSKPNFVSEEQFAEMVKGMNTRAKGSVRKEAMPSTDLPRVIASASSPHTQMFFVPGLLPGQNTFMGNGTHWKYGAAKRLWMGFIRRAIHHAQLTPMQRVHIAWEWKERNRMRDPDNFTGINKKFILDTLVETGILPDDGWDEIAGWTDRWTVDAANPGVLITLESQI